MAEPRWVYFFRPVGMEGPVKIGVSGCPEHRLEQYLSWSPFPLEVAARIEGSFSLEARFHAAFLSHNTHHEWFSAAPEITAAITAILAGTFDIASLPQPKRLRSPLSYKPWTETRRRNFNLRYRLDRAQKRSGAHLPPLIREADSGLNIGDGPVRDAAIKAIEAFIANPVGGEPINSPWAVKARQRLAEQQKVAA